MQLEIFSTTKDVWEAYSVATHGYLISGWDSTSGQIKITNNGSDGGSGTLKPTRSFQLRVSKTSTNSTTAKKTAYDEFTLTLQEGCLNNVLKMDGSLTNTSGGALISDFEYKVTVATSATTVTLTPLYSTSLSLTSCPLTATLYVFDDVQNIWVDQTSSFSVNFVTSFVRTDSGANKAGKLTIYKASSVFITEKIYTMKISITDLQSSDPVKNAIEHTF
jgi:hypothetical protein